MPEFIGRAVVIRKNGGPDVLELEANFSFPPPGANEVMIKTAAFSVNPIDVIVRNGVYGPIPQNPTVLGADVSGTVITAPPTSKFKVGDKVFAFKASAFPRAGVLGTYAEYVALEEDTIAHAPENIPLDEIAGAPVVALTAWQSLKALDPKPGQRILILSASSSVGILAVQFARNLGLFVVGTAGAKNLDYVKILGADEVVDYALGNEPLETNYGGSDATKFDLLIDMIGGSSLEFAVAHLLRPGAAIAHIMNAGSDAAANERHKTASDTGTGPRWNAIFCKPSGEQLTEIAQLLASGKAKLNIGHKLPVEKIREAHEIVAGKHPGGKVIITF